MRRQESEQITRCALPQLCRAAARPSASGHAMETRPTLVVGFAHGATGSDDEVPAVVLNEIRATRPVFRVPDVEYRADRFPAVMGAAENLDLDVSVTRRPHALGITDGERRRRVVVAPGQHEIDRPAMSRGIAVLR